jgi:hypothetical protein
MRLPAVACTDLVALPASAGAADAVSGRPIVGFSKVQRAG